MSIALIVTRGYGNGTLAGDANEVVDRGYSSGAEVVVTADGAPAQGRIKKVSLEDITPVWEQNIPANDWIDEEIEEVSVKPKKKRKVVQAVPFEPNEIDLAVKAEFERIEREKTERKRKRKAAIEMLLRSL